MDASGWNPWKLTAIGMALVIVTALATGLVVAHWKGSEPAPVTAAVPASAPPAVPASAPPAVPTRAVVDACNQRAHAQVGARDKTVDTIKDAAIGAVAGAALGAAGGAIANGGDGAGKGAAIGGIVGGGGGTLYGLAQNRRDDERYRAVYASCLRAKGYAG